MLNSEHPVEERLAALAAHDPDATHDAALTGHVAGCAYCSTVVRELGLVQVALAELPDVPPPRPLRLLPPAADQTGPAASTVGDPVAHWVRRLFAPALTAGAALAMVGVVGTALPGLGGAQSMPAGAGDETAAQLFAEATPAAAGAGEAGTADRAPDGPDAESGSLDAGDTDAAADDLADETGLPRGGVAGEGTDAEAVSAERSPWPMVLFTGVALMLMAALLRWILVPRAG